jgi:2-C-methyl-D-erythritol 4-phosphate cytidylyltransferase
MQNHAIIVAAGQGCRFGGYKQFYPFRGRPLLLYGAEHFAMNRNINAISIVVPRDRIRYTKRLIKQEKMKKVRTIVAGGLRRQDSVLNALNTIKIRSGIVIIHDGVRPVVSEKLLNRGIRLCKKYKAVVFGIRVYDTLKEVRKNIVVKTVLRNQLYLVQTPQFFEINMIKSAFRNADTSVEYTDEAALLESLGIPVYLFKGDRFNFKITQRADLRLLNKIL